MNGRNVLIISARIWSVEFKVELARSGWRWRGPSENKSLSTTLTLVKIVTAVRNFIFHDFYYTYIHPDNHTIRSNSEHIFHNKIISVSLSRASPTSGRVANDILLSVGSMNNPSMKALLFPSARYNGLWFLLMAYINGAVRNSNHRASKWLHKSEQKFWKDVERKNSGIHLEILDASKGDMKEVPCWGPGQITGLLTKFNCPGDLNLGFFLEGLRELMTTLNKIINSPKKKLFELDTSKIATNRNHYHLIQPAQHCPTINSKT